MTKCHSAECQIDVDIEPAYAVVWPGEPKPLKMCEPCAMRARAVGDAMGCSIVVLPWLNVPKMTKEEAGLLVRNMRADPDLESHLRQTFTAPDNDLVLITDDPSRNIQGSDGGPMPDEQCSGPFTDARDCPVHNPRLKP